MLNQTTAHFHRSDIYVPLLLEGEASGSGSEANGSGSGGGDGSGNGSSNENLCKNKFIIGVIKDF